MCLFFLGIIFFTDTSGFSLSKVASPLSYNEKWEVIPVTKEEKVVIDDVFSQTFTYLDSGTKSYSFVSEDGKYVIKLFKMKHLLANKWINHIPIPKILDEYRFEKVAKRDLKLSDIFESCKIAFQDLKKQTGLVYIHLNKSKEWKKKLHLVDKNKKEYFLDLDMAEFVLQKKAIPFEQRISKLMRKNDLVKTRKALKAILDLLDDRCRKGIVCKEISKNANFIRNYGFIDDAAVYVDVAGFQRKDSEQVSSFNKNDFLKASEKISEWLQEYYPELVADFSKEVETFIK